MILRTLLIPKKHERKGRIIASSRKKKGERVIDNSIELFDVICELNEVLCLFKGKDISSLGINQGKQKRRRRKHRF